MTKSKTIEICGVGKVILEKSKLAKRLSLTIRPFKGARVAVPLNISFKKAALFAESKGAWLEKQTVRMADKERQARQIHRTIPIQREPARSRIIERLAQLSARSGLAYRKVFIRNQKTRWGSCSHVNNISLNINLVRLPEILMDYVILHELMHTHVKNHGRRFWEGLAGLIDNPKELDRTLRQYGALLVVED
jgi:predicted metal-dependent hydrolase